MSISMSPFIARTGHPYSPVEAIINLISFLKGSVLDAGKVTSICCPLAMNRILPLVKNQFEKAGPNSRSVPR